MYLSAETVGRFLESMRSAGTTARYVGNVGFTWRRGLSLKVPITRPEKAMREKGYSIETTERLYQPSTTGSYIDEHREEHRL